MTYLKMSNKLKDQEQAKNQILQMVMMVVTPAATIANLTGKTQLQVPRNELEDEQPRERLPDKKLSKI